MEDNYSFKKDLIVQLRKLLEEENSAEAYLKAKALSKKWRRVNEDEESFLEKELSDEFNTLMNELSEKAGDIAVSVEDKKRQLIEKAKVISSGNSFNKGTDQMKELLEEWKRAGRAGKEKDDELWEEFIAARNVFFENKKEYYTNLRQTFSENKKLKEELIEKAKEVENIENLKDAANKSNELMEEWKKIGTAGRKDDDKLWNQFLELRKAFFKRRDQYYDDMKAVFAQRVKDKQELISEAKLYLARSEFTDEEVSAVKELRTKWKEIGNAGKENENKLWEEFNSLINKYYDNMKYYRD